MIYVAAILGIQEVGLLDDQREIVPTSIMWSLFQKHDYAGPILA